MLRRLLVAAVAAACAFGSTLAEPVTAEQAKRAVGNWMRSGVALGLGTGRSAESVRTHAPGNGASFHVIGLSGGGFVVTSADTKIDPVIAFSDSGELAEDDRNPLWVLLKGDLAARQRHTTRTGRLLSAATPAGLARVGSGSAVAGPEGLWAALLATPAGGTAREGMRSTEGGDRLLLSAASGKATIADIRVSPLLETAWSQQDYQNYGLVDADHSCYNYYTPNRWPCGCVATVGAQIMRYFRHPEGEVVPGTYECRIMVDKNWIDASTYYPIYESRRYAMKGGTYAWNSMPAIPANGCSAVQREAIGRLTYDVGVSCRIAYGEDGSEASLSMLVRRLVDRFGYSNAVGATFRNGFYNDGSFGYTLERLKSATIPCLDAGLPVALGISGELRGHAVVGDGYGYANGNLYLHINLGWANLDGGNAWYMPPDIDEFDTIDTVVCNIYPTQTPGASIISGRVLDESGNPVAGAGVAAAGAADTTDAQGVYALILPAGSYTISATKGGKTATASATVAKCVSTRYNDDGSFSSSDLPVLGNVHDVDLTLEVSSAPVGPAFGPGVWTADADAAKAAAAKDGRLVCVVSANYGSCYYSQLFWPNAKDAKFLAWAKANGVYLVSADASCEPVSSFGSNPASSWFSTLYWSWPETDGYIYWPTVATVRPGAPNTPIGYDVFRPGYAVGGGTYDGTVDSLIACLGHYLGSTPPNPPDPGLVTDPTPRTEAANGYTWKYRIVAGGAELFSEQWYQTDVMPAMSGRVVIPDKLGGYPVTSIGQCALADSDDVTSVTEIVIPATVTNIGFYAFNSLDKLERVILPDALRTIREGAFSRCTSLTSMMIPAKVELIEDETVFASGVFSSCTSMENFSVASGNAYYVARDGVIYTKDLKTLVVCPAKKKSVTIPDSVTYIYACAFEYCAEMTALTLPPHLESVGRYPFSNSGIESITIPGSMKRVSHDGFAGRFVEIVISAGVEAIENGAFYDCHRMERLTIPKSVTEIETDAFEYCRVLKTVYVDCGDADRIRDLMSASGFDVTGVQFVESDTPGGGDDPESTSCSIALVGKGWHEVSFNVIPEDGAPEKVFAPVADRIASVSRGNLSWNPRTGGTLTELEVGKGYWLQTTADELSWTVTGQAKPDVEIALKQGWNLVGYPLAKEGAVEKVLATALGTGNIRYISSGSRVYPGRLTTMAPSRGYWIYAERAATITFDGK